MNKIIFFLLTSIWQFSRSEFYRSMADAFERKVSLREFFDREISNARILEDSLKIYVLQVISKRYATGDGATLRGLMLRIAPYSDQMLLSSVDDSITNKSRALIKVADAVDFQIRSLKILGMNLVMPAISVPIVAFLCLITSEIIASIAQSAPASIWVGFNGFVRWLADFINSYSLQISVGLVAFIALIIYVLPRVTGNFRNKLDNMPGFSLYRDYSAVVVLSALAMMLGSGKTLRQALEDLLPTASKWLRWHIQKILYSLEQDPTDYMTAFGKGLMPKTVRARLASLLDSSKSFDEALIKIGEGEVGRLEAAVKVSAQSINFALTGFLISIAVVLSIGQMTIASALSDASDPTQMEKMK